MIEKKKVTAEPEPEPKAKKAKVNPVVAAEPKKKTKTATAPVEPEPKAKKAKATAEPEPEPKAKKAKAAVEPEPEPKPVKVKGSKKLHPYREGTAFRFCYDKLMANSDGLTREQIFEKKVGDLPPVEFADPGRMLQHMRSKGEKLTEDKSPLAFKLLKKEDGRFKIKLVKG